MNLQTDRASPRGERTHALIAAARMYPATQQPALRGASHKEDTKWLLYSAVIVLLLKNPSMIYLTFHQAYKVLYVCAIAIIALDYCAVLAREGAVRLRGALYTTIYAIFVFLSLLILLLDGIIYQKLNLEKSAQFVMNIAQFFPILYVIRRSRRPKQIVEAAYRVAVVLAGFSLVMVLGNYAGTFPFPVVELQFINSDSGVVFLYPPFGFAHDRLPVPPARYRSHSFFSEPAYFAMVLVPFMFYAIMKARVTGKARHVVCFGLLGAAALSTYSVAGFVVTLLTLMSVCLYQLAVRPSAWLKYGTALAAILAGGLIMYAGWYAVGGASADPRLARMVQAIEDREFQWSIGARYTMDHVFGEGIGYSTTGQVFWRTVKRRDKYAEFTNILEGAYYLGLVYLIPLGILLLGAGRYAFAGLRSASAHTRTLATMIWFMLLYNLSVQVFFTAYFSMMLGAFLLILSHEQQDRGARLMANRALLWCRPVLQELR